MVKNCIIAKQYHTIVFGGNQQIKYLEILLLGVVLWNQSEVLLHRFQFKDVEQSDAWFGEILSSDGHFQGESIARPKSFKFHHEFPVI